MNSRRFTAQYLPCFRRKDSTVQLGQETVALRDFNLAYVRLGSNSVIAAMSAARPLFHRKRKSIGGLAMSHKCQFRTQFARSSTSTVSNSASMAGNWD